MTHRWGLSGLCACGVKMTVVGTHARPQRLYWSAQGEYMGTRAPACTREKRTARKAEQLGLFGEKK